MVLFYCDLCFHWSTVLSQKAFSKLMAFAEFNHIFLNYHEISNNAFQTFNLRFNEQTNKLVYYNRVLLFTQQMDYKIIIYLFFILCLQKKLSFFCHLFHRKLYKNDCQLFSYKILGWVIIPPSLYKTSTVTALIKQPLAKYWGGERESSAKQLN